MEEMSTITSPNQVATRLPKWFADYRVILGQRAIPSHVQYAPVDQSTFAQLLVYHSLSQIGE